MEKIISELRYLNGNFPRETLEQAVKMKEEITPILLEELDNIIEHPEIATENQDYMLHIYAMYLLAKFREKRAFARIIDLISLAPDDVEALFGDMLTEGLSSIIYSTFDGRLNILKGIVENPSLNIYARSAALDVYGKLYSDGIVSKEECIGYLKKLIYDNYFDRDSDLATDIQGLVVDRRLFEMIDDIQFLYDQKRIDTVMLGQYDGFIDYIYYYKYDKEPVQYIDDINEKMYWWSCFEQTEDEGERQRSRFEKLEASTYKREKLIKQLINNPKNIGRNDPCPCGSGKKYKKCCLGKEPLVTARFIKGYTESAVEQKVWLKDYPVEEGEKKENEIRITDIFDRESIDIDKLVYLALHHRAIPIWIERDLFKEEMVMIAYLVEAYEKFLSKCEIEGINSFDQYDSKYKIHYRSKEWIEKLEELIDENDLDYEYKDCLEEIKKTIAKFSQI